MKKLGICLLALAMVLGFASCNKDAETTSSSNRWQKITVYYFNDSVTNAITAVYFSEDDIPDGIDKDDLTYLSCFIKKSSSITACTNTEKQEYDFDKNEYSPKENVAISFDFTELVLDGDSSVTTLNGGGYKYEGYVFFDPCFAFVESLDEPKDPWLKYTYTFDDGSILETYVPPIG